MIKHISFYICFLCGLGFAFSGAFPTDGQANNDLPFEIVDPYAFETPPGVKNGAVFFHINNLSAVEDLLISAQSDIADRIELHTHIHEDGVMKMREVENIPAPVGKAAILHPHGDHVMLLGLVRGLKAGDTFPLTLTFQKAGSIHVDVKVKSIGDNKEKIMKHQNHDGHHHHH